MAMELPEVPALEWLSSAGQASLLQGELAMAAGARTDWFFDPGTGESTSNAPVLCAKVLRDFQVAARVTVDFTAMFDAGVLFVHSSNDAYAKLCFELSPAGEHTVVSVVTRSVSDDANGPVIDGDDVWLRISRMGDALAFHWSSDGALWEMLRYFRLAEGAGALQVGFCAQSPTGEGCTARFSSIKWTSSTLANVRDGT